MRAPAVLIPVGFLSLGAGCYRTVVPAEAAIDESVATVPPEADVVEIAAGYGHTCARRSSGSVVCWGANGEGQLGDGSNRTNRLAPVAVSGLTDAVEIAAGWGHTCARGSSGTVACWGYNYNDRRIEPGSRRRRTRVRDPARRRVSLGGRMQVVWDEAEKRTRTSARRHGNERRRTGEARR